MCWKSSHRVGSAVMKNWLLPVSSPALAMARTPSRVNCNLLLNSSSILGTVVLVSLGIPPWIMKSLMIRWNVDWV